MWEWGSVSACPRASNSSGLLRGGIENSVSSSSDNHVHEPPDLWLSRAESKFKDRVPKLVRQEDGDWWYCDNHRVIGVGAGSQTGMRFEEAQNLAITRTQEDVRLGGYIPEEHVKDMDIDGVDVSIVYPTVGLLLYSVPDSGQ